MICTVTIYNKFKFGETSSGRKYFNKFGETGARGRVYYKGSEFVISRNYRTLFIIESEGARYNRYKAHAFELYNGVYEYTGCGMRYISRSSSQFTRVPISGKLPRFDFVKGELLV